MDDGQLLRRWARLFHFDHSVYYGTLCSGVQTVHGVQQSKATKGGGSAVSTQQSQGPDFLIIGAQKAGTSWLHQQLSKHPAIQMPLEKELHFFDGLETGQPRNPIARLKMQGWAGEANRERAKFAVRSAVSHRGHSGTLPMVYHHLGPQSLGSYRRLFTRSPDVVSGESTPAYSVLKESTIALIASEFPDINIVLTLREPVARRWSAKLHIIRARQLDVASMSEAELDRLLDNDDRGNYRTILEKWSRYIPPERLGIFFYDDLVEAPARYLASVCNFLEVEPTSQSALLGERVNETRHLGQIPPSLKAKYCEELRPLYHWLVEHYGEISPHPAAWLQQATNA